MKILDRWLGKNTPKAIVAAPKKKTPKVRVQQGSFRALLVGYINANIGKPFTTTDIAASIGVPLKNVAYEMLNLRKMVPGDCFNTTHKPTAKGWQYVYTFHVPIKVAPSHKAGRRKRETPVNMSGDAINLIEARFDDIIDSINDLRKCILRLYPIANVQERKAANR